MYNTMFGGEKKVQFNVFHCKNQQNSVEKIDKIRVHLT